MADLPDVDHVLIIQDDAVPVPGFPTAVLQIAETHPDTPVCLYLAKLPRDTKPHPAAAMKMNRRYVNLSWRSFLPIVAVLWPVEKLIEFRDWAEDNPRLPGPIPPRSDDAMGGRWKLVTRQTVLACVPSIVDHPDQEPSLIRAHSTVAVPRTAAFLAGDACEYDWSMP